MNILEGYDKYIIKFKGSGKKECSGPDGWSEPKRGC